MAREQKFKIAVFAGEESGDLHGARLIQKLNQLENPTRIFAFGGPQMKKAGATLVKNMLRFSVVGITEVLGTLPKLKSLEKYIRGWINKEQPDLIILIDYPGFFMRLMKFAYGRMPVVYYIPPKVWVWKQKRAELLKKYCSQVYTIFPFEAQYFGDKASYFGHPLVDIVKSEISREEFLKKNSLSEDYKYIALAPGSRKQELKTMLPVFLEAAERLSQKNRKLGFLIPAVETLPKSSYSLAKKYPKLKLKVVQGDSYDLINACEFVIGTSGTLTLEAALLDRPMVICNKGSALTWMAYKFFVKTKFIGLPNLIADKEVCPELLQKDCSGENIAQVVHSIIGSESKMNKQKSEFEKVRSQLGEDGVLDRVVTDLKQRFME